MKPITILTGPTASGQNTISNLYAMRFCERCAVIDVDVVRWMLHQPHLPPWDGAEGFAQHQLGVHHACLLAKSFIAAGCEVVILDVLWADLAHIYHDELRDYPLRIVRLLPTWDESLRRLHESLPSISDSEARWVYDTQTSLHEFDFTLDNSQMSADEVAAWLAALPQAG